MKLFSKLLLSSFFLVHFLAGCGGGDEVDYWIGEQNLKIKKLAANPEGERVLLNNLGSYECIMISRYSMELLGGDLQLKVNSEKFGTDLSENEKLEWPLRKCKKDEKNTLEVSRLSS